MSFLGPVSFIKKQHGEAVLARIVEDSGTEGRRIFSKKIDGLAHQPYAAWIAFLRSADKHLGKGDLEYCKVIGDIAARSDLNTIFKGYALMPAAETMIRACTPIWAMYTEDAGTMVACDVRPESTILRIYDFPDMDPAHCKLMEGWMIAAMDFVGARVLPGACERLCCSRGDLMHEFWCQWQPKEQA